MYSDEDSDGNLEGLIDDDDYASEAEEGLNELGKIIPKRYYDYEDEYDDESDSNMEARYDEIESEEENARVEADYEDR